MVRNDLPSPRPPTPTAPGLLLIPHIRYSSPYGGHPITRRPPSSPRAAYAALTDFLTRCTDWDGRWPPGSITVQPPDKYMPDGWAGDEAAAVLTDRFGPPRIGVTFNDLSTGETSHERVWDLPPSTPSTPSADLHAWAIEFVFAQPTAKRGYPDPVHWSCSLAFRLRHPDTGEILPGQAPAEGWHAIHSSIMPFLAPGNCSSHFDLRFPFAEADDAFLEYIRALRPHLPFRLAKGNFRLSTPNRAGTDFRVRRVPRELFDDL